MTVRAERKAPGEWASRGCFVTGTDTGVGKTWVVLGLMWALREQGLLVVGMKPVASGCTRTVAGLRSEDAVFIMENSSIRIPYELVNPYGFEAAISPHLAALATNVDVSIETVLVAREALASQAQCLVVEGIGGWRVPINQAEKVSDLARRLGYPVVLVVGLRLGCINHALLTAEAIVADKAGFAGWIANHVDPAYSRVPATLATIGRHITAPLLGYIPWLAQNKPQHVASYLKVGLQQLTGWIV